MAKRSYRYEYPRPMLTVDAVVFSLERDRLSVLLIRRAHDPYAGCWAFPGGFVDENEPLLDAMRRELQEETNAEIGHLYQFGAYGEPGRDPRGWCVTVSFYTIVRHDQLQIAAADDAEATSWKSVARPPKLAFDHKEMLGDAVARMRQDIYRVSVALDLLDETFTRSQLIELYCKLDPHAPSPARLLKRLEEAGVIERSSAGKLRRKS